MDQERRYHLMQLREGIDYILTHGEDDLRYRADNLVGFDMMIYGCGIKFPKTPPLPPVEPEKDDRRMKRFLLFAGAWYYPSGAMRDFVGDFDTFEEALHRSDAKSSDWVQVLDQTERKTWFEDRSAGARPPQWMGVSSWVGA